MAELAIVVLSKTDTYLTGLIKSCLTSQPDLFSRTRVIVVDDGLSEHLVADLKDSGVEVYPGVKPFCFARNANIAISRVIALGLPMLLVNDDTEVLTPRFLDKISVLTQSPYTAISCSIVPIQGVGNPSQAYELNAKYGGTWEIPRHEILCFVSVLFQAGAFERVGLLDERFVGYGYEDNDWCLRAHNLGLPLGITRTLVFRHIGPTGCGGTYKKLQRYRDMVMQNIVLFNQKWAR